MIKVAILDDYQNVYRKFVDWENLRYYIKITNFNDFIGNRSDLPDLLKEFQILCLMRERTPINKKLIEQLPNLKLVVTSGMWNASIDQIELKKKGIILCGTDTEVYPTAELTWSLIMLGWRGILKELENMKSGKWQTTIGRCLNGKTLGIFGLGKQGLQVANFGKTFGMDVIAWSHNLKSEDCRKAGVKHVNYSELFKSSDILTIHTRLSERTRGFIDIQKLSSMKKNSFLVNTSRGPIIKEEDLIYCLENDIIGGAALDVYDIEPLPATHSIRKVKNLILTPHIGYVSSESYSKFFQGYYSVIKNFISGKIINEIV